MSPRIEDYALRFAALLGRAEHGRWLITPAVPAQPARRYRPRSLILERDWETAAGRLRVTDFMPPRGDAPHIVRVVDGLSGRVPVRAESHRLCLVDGDGFASVAGSTPLTTELGQAACRCAVTAVRPTSASHQTPHLEIERRDTHACSCDRSDGRDRHPARPTTRSGRPRGDRHFPPG